MSRNRQPRPAASSSVPFLVLDENRLAWSAVQSTIDADLSKVERGRIVLIHGPSGTGKSHLCEILVRALSERDPDSVFHASAMDITRKRIEPDASDDDHFVGILPVTSCVVLEDIHFLARDRTTQSQLAAQIDEYCRSGTILVCTSIHSPAGMNGLSPRLGNRLRSAACVSVRRPGPQSREEIMTHFCSHLQIALGRPVIRLFAKQLAVSVRELLGVLLRFDEIARQQRRAPDSALARAFLRHEISKTPVSVAGIAKAVAREFGVRLGDMKSASRDHALAIPRQCAMFLMREIRGEHFSQIGKYFGGRSHSTVVHACNRIRELIEDDVALRQRVGSVRRVLDVP